MIGFFGSGGAPGLFAGPNPAGPQPQPQRKTGGLQGLLQDIFAGQSDPRLTEEQNDALRKRALLMAGLQIMAASGQGGSTGQAHLAGVQGGQAQAHQLA